MGHIDIEQCCEQECCREGKSIEMDPAAGMMKMAEDAWADLMKEKLKAQFEKLMGPQMNKMAVVISQASMAHHGGKMKAQADEAEWRQKIMDSMRM